LKGWVRFDERNAKEEALAQEGGVDRADGGRNGQTLRSVDGKQSGPIEESGEPWAKQTENKWAQEAKHPRMN
jgi:hypothetical protein